MIVLSCTSMAISWTQAHPSHIHVAALTARGIATDYTQGGPALWVSGFAGSSNGVIPGIMTLDDSGCERGRVGVNSDLNYPTPRNPFETADGHPENPNCNYSSTFSGTSAAAPTVRFSVY